MRSHAPRALDPEPTQVIADLCGVSAEIGMRILQLDLLARQLLTLHHHQSPWIVLPLDAAAWMLGNTVGTRWGRAWPTRLWGWVLLLFGAAIVWDAPFPGWLLAALLGISSGAWLTHPRPWPPMREGAKQAVAALGLPLGLCLVWLLPAVAPLIGWSALLPLRLLEHVPASRCPLPPVRLRERRPRRQARLLQVSVQDIRDVETLRLGAEVDRATLPLGWWWPFLAREGRLPLTILTNAKEALLNALWWLAPTFVARSFAQHQQRCWLLWLLGGTLLAWLLFWRWLPALRLPSLLGEPGKILSAEQENAHSLVRGAGVVLVLSLLGLGAPLLQEPVPLACCLGLFTLAELAWSRVVPRLLPSLLSEVRSGRNAVPWQFPTSEAESTWACLLDALAREQIARWRTALSLLLVFPLGWGCLYWNVDLVLSWTGGGLAFLLWATLMVWHLQRLLLSRRTLLSRRLRLSPKEGG